MSDGARRGFFRADDLSAADVEIQISAVTGLDPNPGLRGCRRTAAAPAGDFPMSVTMFAVPAVRA